MGDLRETFECAPSLRIEAHERLAALQFAQLNAQLAKDRGDDGTAGAAVVVDGLRRGWGDFGPGV